MAYFPFMIQLGDKTCLIAGGGKVAFRKAQMMLQFGANVKIVAPQICMELLQLKEEESRLDLEKRKISLSDLDGADVVIMATNDSKVNQYFADNCKERRILVNVVDVKEDCGFYFPAVIKQEEVVIAVSTGGNSPLLASKIKKDIKDHIREDYGRIASDLGKIRETILEKEPDETRRKEAFQNILEQKMKQKIVKVGTRGSALARIQTDMVIASMQKAFPEYQFEPVILTTRGDKQTDRPIMAFGGKAVFVEEFEHALLDGSIDIAVHSAKDMPNPCMKGLTIAGTLKRACTQDVLIYPKEKRLQKADAFVVGTSSLRRQYQIRELYPNAVCKDLRGNIGTRIQKLKDGGYDAIILAAAGIERQGLDKDPELTYQYLTLDEMLPAAGQAIIAMETRQDGLIKEMVSKISDPDTQYRLTVERAVLTRLNAGCHEPIGVWCEQQKEQVSITLMQVSDEKVVRKKVQGSKEDWQQLVEQLCDEEGR